MTVYIPIGISGAGKSAYQKKNLANVNVICPDDIRKKFTGSCSDQTMNTEVFEEAYRQLSNYAYNDENVYFSSTNLSVKAVQSIYNCVLQNAKRKKNLHFRILLLSDSLDEELCRSRVKADLEKGVDRSNTLILADDLEGNQLDYDILHEQHLQYLNMEKAIFEWRGKLVEDSEDDLDIRITKV